MALNGVRQFSHLTLEENEEYIADVSCICKSANIRRCYGNAFKARIRVGSKSIIVEPDDSTMSMIKILFSQIVELRQDVAQSKMTIFSRIVRLVDVQVIDGKSRSVTPNEVLYSRSTGDSGMPVGRDLFELEVTVGSSVGQQLMVMSSELWAEHSESRGSPSKLDGLVGKWISLLYNKEIFNVEYEFLLDHRDQFLISKPLIVTRIKPFTKHRGILHIVSSGICFKPLPNFSNKPYKRIPLKSVWFVFKRIYSMKPNSVEIVYGKDLKSHMLTTGKGRPHWRSLFLEFQSLQDREHIVAFLQSYLMSLNSKGCQWSSQVPPYASCLCPSSCLPMLFVDPLYASQSPCFKRHMQNLWVNGAISTYHYLDYLNSIGGRSKGDLTQYPVFPWTAVSFTSAMCSRRDFSSPSNYRDLSRPLGAINRSNLEMLKSRMKDLPASEQFLYGSHYSTPGYISYFLVRQFPEYQLKLHGGDFDVWSRMFHSMSDTWRTILEGKTTYMELIPQFYEQNPDFLLNSKLNIRTNSGSLLNVHIPSWELGDDFAQLPGTPLSTSRPSQAEAFLRSMRYALEGEVVSQHIHEWIDLVFGCKQRGAQAHSSDNLFHPITYINSSIAVALDPSPVYAVQEHDTEASSGLYQELCLGRSLDGDDDAALKAQVEEFGQVPIKLFTTPHPQRGQASMHESAIMQHLDHKCANMPWFVLFKSTPQLLEARYDFSHKEDRPSEKTPEPLGLLRDPQSHQVSASALAGEEFPAHPSRKDASKRDLGVQEEGLLRPSYKLCKGEPDREGEEFLLVDRDGCALMFKDSSNDFQGLADLQEQDLQQLLSPQKTVTGKAPSSSSLTSVCERPGELVLIAVFDRGEERLSFYVSVHGLEDLGFKCIYSNRQDIFGNKATCLDLLVCSEGSVYLTIGTQSGDLIYLRFRLLGRGSPSSVPGHPEPGSLQSMFVMGQKEKALKQFNMGSVHLLASIQHRQHECCIVAVSQGGTLLASKHYPAGSQQDFRKSAWLPMVDIPIRYEKIDSILQLEMTKADGPDNASRGGESKRQICQHTPPPSGCVPNLGKVTADIDSGDFCFSCILSDTQGRKQRLWSFGGPNRLFSLDLTGMLSGVFSAQGGSCSDVSSAAPPHAYGLKEIEESQKVDWIFLRERSLVLYVGFHAATSLSVMVFWDIRQRDDAKVHRVIFVPGLRMDSVCWDKHRRGLLVLGHQLVAEHQPDSEDPSQSPSGGYLPKREEGIYFLQEKQWNAATKSNHHTLQILTLKGSFELLLNLNMSRTPSLDHDLPELRRPTITCTEKFVLLSSYSALLALGVSRRKSPQAAAAHPVIMH